MNHVQRVSKVTVLNRFILYPYTVSKHFVNRLRMVWRLISLKEKYREVELNIQYAMQLENDYKAIGETGKSLTAKGYRMALENILNGRLEKPNI